MQNHEIASFFADASVDIYGNSALRDPQREGYEAIQSHFARSSSPCYVQLPVGCGKTGLMGLTPFGLAKGRVLIVAPNLDDSHEYPPRTRHIGLKLFLHKARSLRSNERPISI